MQAHAGGSGCVDAAEKDAGVEAARLERVHLEDEVAEFFLRAEKRMLGCTADHVPHHLAVLHGRVGLGMGADYFPAGEIAPVEEFSPRRLGGKNSEWRKKETNETGQGFHRGVGRVMSLERATERKPFGQAFRRGHGETCHGNKNLDA